MKILRGKTKDEIIYAYFDKYKILQTRKNRCEIYDMIKVLKRPYYKHILLLWTIPFILIGLTFLITLIGALAFKKFPVIFIIEDFIFYKTFINIMFGFLQFIISFLLIIVPIFRMKVKYDWYFEWFDD